MYSHLKQSKPSQSIYGVLQKLEKIYEIEKNLDKS
jgi:hypothetical protein